MGELKRRCSASSNASSGSPFPSPSASHVPVAGNKSKRGRPSKRKRRKSVVEAESSSSGSARPAAAKLSTMSAEERLTGLSSALRQISDVKVDLAIQTYEVLEEKIRGLDDDLRKCAAEFNRGVPVGSPQRFAARRKRVGSLSSDEDGGGGGRRRKRKRKKKNGRVRAPDLPLRRASIWTSIHQSRCTATASRYPSAR